LMSSWCPLDVILMSQLTAPGARLVAVPDAGFWWDTLAAGSTTERPWLAGRNRQGVQGAHLNPLGLFLNPLGLFLRTSIPFI
jgi:hypothetical protein